MCNLLAVPVEVISVILQFQRIGNALGEYPGSLDIILNSGVAGPHVSASPTLVDFAKSFYRYLYTTSRGVIGLVNLVFAALVLWLITPRLSRLWSVCFWSPHFIARAGGGSCLVSRKAMG